MTITADQRSAATSDGIDAAVSTTGGDVKGTRRRIAGWAWAAAAAVILLGVLVGVLSFSAASRATQVFVAAGTIERGSVIGQDDLSTISLAADQTTTAIPATEAADLIGAIAAVDIPPGGLITESSVTDALPVPTGQALVGLTLRPGQLPAQRLVAGDTVYLVPVPPQGVAAPTPVGPTDTIPATVSQVRPIENTTDVIVDVYVSGQSAAQVTAQAAGGLLAIYLAPGDNG